MAYINIYYDLLEYTEIVEVEKTSLIDLFSSIGGTLGLFLGMSFLSIIEIFELIVAGLIFAFKSKKIKNNSNV